MEFKVRITKSRFFVLLVLLVGMFAAILVTAFGTANPAVFGHSGGEIDVAALAGSAPGLSVGFATSASSASSASTASTASTANACNGDSSCDVVSLQTTSSSFIGNTGSSGTFLRITGSGDPTLQFERISGGSTLYSVSFNGVTLNMGSITVSSCTGCSTLAEMMQVSGVEEGDAVCISAVSGAFERCGEDSSLAVVGIATTHAEQILNLGCGTGNNKLMLGGNAQDWRHAGCEGWFPVALEGVHEFTKVRCFRSDGSPLEFGDRLVTASDGRLRPLSGREAGGDAVVARAKTVCSSGEETGVIQAVLR